MYRKSYPTHTRRPNSIHRRNHLSTPCRVYPYLAAVRPRTERQIDTNSTWREFSTDGLEISSRTSMTIVLSRMATRMSCGAAECRARRGMVGPHHRVFYLRSYFHACRRVPKTPTLIRSLVVPANNQQFEFVKLNDNFNCIRSGCV